MIEAAVAIVQGERGLAAVFKVVAVAVGQLEGDAARVRALVGDLSNVIAGVLAVDPGDAVAVLILRWVSRSLRGYRELCGRNW